jgi:signal transduction histidine kinase
VGARSLPTSARALIALVIAIGAATAAGWATDIPTWGTSDVLAFAGVAIATAVAERFPLELHYRSERAVYSLGDAVWTGSLLVARPSVVALAVGAGVLAGQALLRRPARKVAFNVGQFMVGMSAALAVFAALGAPPADAPAAWVAAAVAMGTFQVINTVLVGVIIALVESRPFRHVALASTGMTHWLGNIAVGILGAVVWVAQPLALPLLLVPLGLTHFAYRGWLRTLQERDWMGGMADAADAIADSGDLSRRVTETGEDDAVGRLARTLNRMLARIHESFAREQRFIRETSHELRTPLAICSGYLEVLSSDASREEIEETVDIVMDELRRMARIVDDLSRLAYTEDPASLRRGELPIDRFLAGVVAKASPLVNGRLEVEPAPRDGQLLGDPQLLTQALINLLKNAHDHTPDASPIRLRALARVDAWRFEVADVGGGLAREDEQRVFRPFYRGDQSGGSGLGLAIVSGIARAHEGRAGVDNQPGKGATFWLEVPR